MATWIKKKSNLILVRHGQSTYNLQNKFTGWKDVELTNKGINEAREAGKLLSDIDIDYAFTSSLKRAQTTLDLILQYNNSNPEIYRNKALNERNYGKLVGQNKAEAALKYGSNQVQLWRRSYDVAPPSGESLEMTYKRTIPYYKSHIENIIENKNIIISAHGNSLRSIVMYLLNFSKDEILKTEIGWCEPLVFNFENMEICSFELFERKGVKSMTSFPKKISTLI